MENFIYAETKKECVDLETIEDVSAHFWYSLTRRTFHKNSRKDSYKPWM
ncbi:hypothetical protein SAMN04490208_3067 [Pseudomonas poae]|uniref:Uncharacterized protein n=1 Tax=Pseudomonas poae TaxID=200451 RepID=A0ABY0RL04_9PSED|nr:hypothetical protein SAMN04490208_3067 [Pseudomonas poae]